jgi:hypothetical protein
MAKSFNPDRMSREELEEYVNTLPAEKPPKMTNAAWLALFGLVVCIAFFMRIKTGDYTKGTWLMLAGGIGCFIGAGYIIYRVLTYGRQK